MWQTNDIEKYFVKSMRLPVGSIYDRLTIKYVKSPCLLQANTNLVQDMYPTTERSKLVQIYKKLKRTFS